jgi:hypothetical protein
MNAPDDVLDDSQGRPFFALDRRGFVVARAVRIAIVRRVRVL